MCLSLRMLFSNIFSRRVPTYKAYEHDFTIEIN